MGKGKNNSRVKILKLIRSSNLVNGKVVKIAASVVVGLLLIWYVWGVAYYSSHFLNNTELNGIDVSKMTISNLEETIENYSLTIRERGIEESDMYIEKIKGEDIDIHIVSVENVKDIMKEQNQFLWFIKGKNKFEKEKLIDYDEEKLERKIQELKGLDSQYAKKPVNASISEYDAEKGYDIIKENEGNFLNESKTKEAVEKAVCNLDSEINLDKEDCYKKPKIKADSEKVVNLLDKLNKYVELKITYKFGETDETVDGSLISQWLKVQDYKVVLDSVKVQEFVVSLRKKYDTIFRTRKFKTTYGKTVTVEGGDYGWWMNYVKEAEELEQMILDGKSGERKPVYYQEAVQYGENDYGNSYVEINLTAQHLFVYKDGVKVLETDFVSGNTSLNRPTNTGTFGITYKERYSVLVGETYESLVSYWMPFDGDIGLHDAIWKTQFGKNFYITDGSHGCINLPYLTAEKIYSLIEKGTPVIVYKLKGTESSAVTTQSEYEIAQAAVEAIDEIGKVTKYSGSVIDAARYMYNKVGSAKKYVTNYSTLIKAENEYKKLK